MARIRLAAASPCFEELYSLLVKAPLNGGELVKAPLNGALTHFLPSSWLSNLAQGPALHTWVNASFPRLTLESHWTHIGLEFASH